MDRRIFLGTAAATLAAKPAPPGVEAIDCAAFGRRLQAARQAAGLTIPRAAAGVGVSEAQWVAWESGREIEQHAFKLNDAAQLCGTTLCELATA
jgi:hypothetical protein